MKRRANQLVYLGLLGLFLSGLTLACETEDEGQSGTGETTSSADATGDTSLDVVDVTDASDIPPADLDTSGPCPADPIAAEGTACGVEGASCGSEHCTDPCQFCNILMCTGGVWQHLEAHPDPACFEDTSCPGADCAEAPDVDPDPQPDVFTDSYCPGADCAEAPDLVPDAEDPCANQGCGETPICGQDCGAECGCCGCSTGQTFCGDYDGASALYACADNCYVVVPCAPVLGCVDAGPYGVECADDFPTCDDVQAAYDHLTGDAGRACDTGEDCHIVSGQCSFGIGGCWEAVNAKVSEAELRALGQRFADLGCTTWVCDCMESPADVACVDGLCQAAE